MHPHAPCHAPGALVDQAEVVSQRRRRGGARLVFLMRGAVLCGAMAGVTVFALWLKEESPHPTPADATRESPLVEARSLKSPLETTKPTALRAYALQRGSSPEEPAPQPPVAAELPAAAPISKVQPVWLVADAARSAEMLRQDLRDRGAQQTGPGVRLTMLNVAELLGMTDKIWAASLTTATAKENQTSALLLTFYLYHLDKAGDAAGVQAMLQAMDQGMPQAQAVKDFILAGRSVAEFEREMGMMFAAVGVELQFTRRGGATFKP